VLRAGIWYARVTVTRNGKNARDWYTLDTSDHATALRRKDKLLREFAAGRSPDAAASVAGAPDTVAAFADTCAPRLAAGDVANLRLHVVPALGTLALDEVKPAHVKGIRDKVIAAGARRGTVGKVLGAMRRLFAAAVEDELVEHNPAADVQLLRQRGADREIRKQRTVLTDEEIAKFVACADVDLELRMVSIVARCEGGMRTGDLHAWDWSMIDLRTFAACAIPRSKTAAPEPLDVPEVLRPALRAWWEHAGRPSTGPVFPVRKGKRAGDHKAPNNSYAERLRRDLFRAGVVRLPPVEVPATRPGMRTDLGRAAMGTKPAPNPRDPLYFETDVSLPVDFHSFRRAFNTALAGANVNVQRAMRLAGHADVATHMRYVRQTAEMRAIPEAALPRIPAVPFRAQSNRSTVNHRESEGGDDEGEDHSNRVRTSVLCVAAGHSGAEGQRFESSVARQIIDVGSAR
jgi:integrase